MLGMVFIGGGASPVGATAACPVGATMDVVAHQDDDLLFLSPDLIHDIQANRCVRTVYVTSGVSDGDASYMEQRENGVKAAYAQMAGVANSWTTADAGIAGHPIPLLTLSGKPSVSLLFMRLPQAEWGAPFNPNASTLRNLWSGSITSVQAQGGTSTYTKTQLISTLAALMTNFQPDTIRTQDYVGTFGDDDHDDHHAASYFARSAHLAYAGSHTFIGYQDYETQTRPQNVTGADLTAKTNALYTYLNFDEGPCGSPPNCGNNEYSAWLKRQYVKGTESGADTTPPVVASVTPASGASNVSLGTSVSATFSEAIAPASVTGTSFVLRNGASTVAATVSASGSTATLQPSAALQPGVTYTATLLSGTNGIKDLAGNALAADYSWSFTTTPPDTTPPTVTAVTPANGASNVSLGTALSATFSEPIAPASVTGSSFVLRDGGGNTVTATVSASGSTATLAPSANLQPSTTYTATLLSGANGIKDTSGNALASDFVWSFTTVTVDVTPPASTVAFPVAAGNYNAAGWTAGCATAGICGTAADAGSGVLRVELSIRRVSTNRWWTGTGYSSTTERWVLATGTTSWRYSLASSTFPGAGSYAIRVRATDNSGNVETPATTTFVYDNTNPSSTVTFPIANTSYTTVTWNAGCAVSGVCGTATDATSGVQAVEVSVRRGTTTYWDGTSFSSTTEVFLPATGTTTWSFAFPASRFPASGNYRIRVRARDNAGNVQSPSTRTISFAP